MQTVFTLEALPKSIFLAGPTPRDLEVLSWRPEALRLLEQLGFEGQVFVPEASNWAPHDHYDDQIHWEWEALNLATVVVFWVPRDLNTLPAFTTNVEFGLLAQSGKLVLGFPQDAPKMRYLEKLAERFSTPVFHSIEDTLKAALAVTTKPFGSYSKQSGD
jgi:nucleoside 2-deoxyribosyltransferase